MATQANNGIAKRTPIKEQSGETNLQVMHNEKLPTQRRMIAFEEILVSQIKRISDCIPRSCGLTPERMMRLVLGSFRENPTLLNCTTESIFLSINEAATLGLQLDGTLGHAYLIPYKTECKLLPGYKGLLDLARRQDKINIKTRCVYQGDEFEYEEGDADFIRHRPNQSGDFEFSDDLVSHVYLIAKDMETDAVICRSVWSRARIEAHKKKYSKAWHRNDNPWKTAWGSMARKTLIRDSINRGEIPVSVEVLRLAGREEQYEAKFIEAPQVKRLTMDEVGEHLVTHATGFSSANHQHQEAAEERHETSDEAEEFAPFEKEDSNATEIVEEEIDEHAGDELYVQDGESPKNWEQRILDAIHIADCIDDIQAIQEAIHSEHESGRISVEMMKRLSLQTAKKTQQIAAD